MLANTTARNPAARHPMRRMISPPTPLAISDARSDDHDLKLFALSFTAFFICIYSLIY